MEDGTMMRNLTLLIALTLALHAVGCAEEDTVGTSDDNYAIEDPGWEVWQPVNKWTDVAPNGESYELFYATWLETIQQDENAPSGHKVSYVLRDGTVVPAPKLECSDTALFLRFLFAQEYGLPMVVYGNRTAMGHFGWITPEGTRGRRYLNYQLDAPRGSDPSLQQINRYLPDDLQSYPHEDATIGQYMDAVLTNKRFGVFMQDVLNMYFSGNIAEPTNTYYIKPEFIRAGDVQMHRSHPWDGIGHTLTIQRVNSLNGFLRSVDLIQSYMPTHPWISDGYSELTSYRPNPENFSGLRRWKRPVLRYGRWYLEKDGSVAASDDEAVNNPETFEALFNISPEEQVAALLDTIESSRAAQFENPNSCRRRENREDAFDILYELYMTTPELYGPLGFTSEPTLAEIRPAVDKQYRTINDFIWAKMHYESAWVCHWNPSNTAVNQSMYQAAVAYNQQVALANGCQGLRIFRSENVDNYDGSDGFDDLKQWALANGYQWDNYYLDPSEGDEGGTLHNVVTDELADPNLVDYFCSIYDDLEYWGG